LPALHLVANCSNIHDAVIKLSETKVDLLLMDINIAGVNGLTFLKSLKDPPNVIFTTAYNEYAVESYELQAIDYLLKPIAFDRFSKAIDKAIKTLQPGDVEEPRSNEISKEDEIIFVKSEGRSLPIEVSRIWLIQGLKDYVKIYVDQQMVVVHSTMKSLEEKLIAYPYFLRVNKSYIINTRHITHVENSIIRINNVSVQIGITYRKKVTGHFKGINE
jgi:DNA-binding LytR/AlgR family response regulator